MRAPRALRRVDDEVAAAAAEEVDDRRPRALLGHLADVLDGEAGGGERAGGAGGREQLEAERRRAPPRRGRRPACPRPARRGTPCRSSGARRPAARSAFANAVGRSDALAITSPVERISGPEHRVGAREAREREHRGLDADLSQGVALGGRPRSASFAPAARRHAASTRLTPVALLANGTVRDARGFASSTKTSPSATASWTFSEPDDAERGRRARRTTSSTSRARARRQRRRRQHAGASRRSGRRPPRRAA